jgi:hypothetical protein
VKWVAIICALAATPVMAQTPGDAAMAASVQLKDARTAIEAASGRSDRVAALTETVQAYEAGLRDGLRRAAIRQRTLETHLNARSDEVARLLGVLQTMGRPLPRSYCCIPVAPQAQHDQA